MRSHFLRATLNPLGNPIAGTPSYSATSGTSVSPAYPTGIQARDIIVMFVGQKPVSLTVGGVTTPSGWTLQTSRVDTGGYNGAVADTGNTSIFIFTKDTVATGLSGSVTVTLSSNDVAWATIIRIPYGTATPSFDVALGQRTTTPVTPLSVTLSYASVDAPNLKYGDLLLWGMCIATDQGLGSNFSSPTIAATGLSFTSGVKLVEPVSSNGLDIAGFIAYARVRSGNNTTYPTVNANLSYEQNVRGPLALLRIRKP